MTCPHIISGCGYPEGECSGACLPRALSPFAKSARRSYSSSLAGTKATERINVVQTDKLRPFTQAERTGHGHSDIKLKANQA